MKLNVQAILFVPTFMFTIVVSSPRPGAKNVEEHLEELQHDLALIGQIAGLVASLRKNYDVSFPLIPTWCV